MKIDWKEKAEKWAMDKFDYILDSYVTSDFIEFVGQIGGDLVTYRYYTDNRIVER